MSTPTARDVVKRTLSNLKKIGTEEQRAEAIEIEKLLDQSQAEAVSFAREEEPAAPAGEGAPLLAAASPVPVHRSAAQTEAGK